MSDFNEFFKSRGAKTLVDRYLKNVDMYSSRKITSYTFEILSDNYPASYFTENGLTATFRVAIKYILDDDGEELTTEFEVPREIDDVFIIEGKYRIPTNTLNSDFDIRFRTVGTGDHLIIFDYNRRYNIAKKVLKIERRGETDLSLVEQRVEIKYDNIDSVTGEKKELLKLTEDQIRKLQIKLDLDYRPEYITKELIDQCIAFGDDRMKDLIIDKTIDTVSTSFMKHMIRGGAAGPSKFIRAKRNISGNLLKYGKLPDPITVITNLATRFFKGTSDSKKKGQGSGDDSNLQVPPGINAINLGSLSDKVSIPKTVAYNPTFSDIIDLADTPINQNTNLQNSLTVSTHITDEGILFDVFDKNFTKITIKYLDYLNLKVCSSEYVDYEHKTLKPNADGEVEVKYRMKRKMVSVGEVDLIDLHPDYRLSLVTRRLPFVNSTDSVRISMGTSMLKQSIPLVNAQRPLVDTGRGEELKDNSLNEKYGDDEEGIVSEINEDKVIIKGKSGKITEILRKTAIKSQNDVAVYTEPKVKVGQKVKKGDVITGEISNTLDSYKAGVNALVLFHAYFGLVNEDALVVSESFANRLTSYSIIDFSINITDQKCLKWIAPIGTKVKSGDPIVSLYRAVRMDNAIKALTDKLGGIYGESDMSTAFTVEDLLVSNNIDEGYVSDVMIQYNSDPQISSKDKKPDYTLSLSSQKEIDDYMSDFDKKRKVIYDQFPEYVAADRLRPIIMNPKEFKIVYTVRVRIIKKTIAMVGSKITNRYGGKGVVSAVKPDELMPIMVDKSTGKQHRVEVVMNPYSTISRKIAGVLWEQDLGNIAHRIYDLVDEYKKTKTGQKKIMPMIEKYYPGRYTDLSVEEFIHLHETQPIEETYHFCVGCYSDFTGEKIEKMMEELGVEAKSDILLPETELADLEELKENLDPEEYKRVVDGMKGKLRKIDKPLQCGWMTLEELYHIPSYSNKVTTSLYGPGRGGVNFRKDQPILGRGLYRETGQKIGEMELWALLSRNARAYIQSARGETAKEDNQKFLNNLLGLGLTVKDDKGYNQGGSNLKAQLAGMKTKFRLKIPKK